MLNVDTKVCCTQRNDKSIKEGITMRKWVSLNWKHKYILGVCIFLAPWKQFISDQCRLIL